MGLLAIRRLVENYTISELRLAEYAIIQETELAIDVEGKDQAAMLTNVIAAVWILEEMQRGADFREAVCEYSKKVRDTIEI
jgi:hypothetical protein